MHSLSAENLLMPGLSYRIKGGEHLQVSDLVGAPQHEEHKKGNQEAFEPEFLHPRGISA